MLCIDAARSIDELLDGHIPIPALAIKVSSFRGGVFHVKRVVTEIVTVTGKMAGFCKNVSISGLLSLALAVYNSIVPSMGLIETDLTLYIIPSGICSCGGRGEPYLFSHVIPMLCAMHTARRWCRPGGRIHACSLVPRALDGLPIDQERDCILSLRYTIIWLAGCYPRGSTCHNPRRVRFVGEHPTAYIDVMTGKIV